MGNPGTDAFARLPRKLAQDFEYRAIERHAVFSAGVPASDDAVFSRTG
jgi:hypothetical protein